MTPTRTCTRCLDRPAADGLGWCRGCRHRIDRDLGDLPALAVDLADTMARVSGARTGDHRRSADTPLPYAERAAEALHGKRNSNGKNRSVNVRHENNKNGNAKNV